MTAAVGSEVALSIYELHGTSGLNVMTRAAGLGGAYHVGVEVYWLEWSFGWSEEGPGVYMVLPGTSGLGTFTERVSLGKTPFKPKEVLSIINEMRRTWSGPDYNVLRKNCAHFSVALVQRLRVAEAPAWVNSLASVGDRLVSALGEEGAEEAAELATPALEDRAPPPMALIDDDDAAENLGYSGDDLEQREMAWRRAKDFVMERAAAFENAARYEDLTVDFRWGTSTTSTSEQVKSDLLHFQSFRRAVAVATSVGMRRRPTVADVFAEESDEEPQDPEDEHVQDEKMSVLWMKAWAGGIVRARLRLQSAWDERRWPPAMPEPKDFASRFEVEMRKLGSSPQAAQDWPRGAVPLVRGLECITSPGGAPFGERAELPGGFSQPVKFAAVGLEALAAPVAPVAGSLHRLQRLQVATMQRQAASRMALVGGY